MSSKIEIGRGTFGIVFLETDFHPVTASKYILKSSDPKIEQTFQREWEALKLLSHPNIVQVYELSEEDFCGKPYHVIKMEFCVRGSLRQVINNRKIIYSMKTFSCWAEHLLAGLVCLENHGIIHRDLKPENVLVTRDWILKIGDFGCVRRENDTKELSKDGTLRYMSPECAGFGMATGKRKVTCKSDLYASGLIMWEILERRKVFTELSEYTVLQNLMRGINKLECLDAPFEVVDLISRCTRIEHNQRPKVNDVHKVMVGIRRAYSNIEFEPIIEIDNDTLVKPIAFEQFNVKQSTSTIGIIDDSSTNSQLNTIIDQVIIENLPEQMYLKEIEEIKKTSSYFSEEISRKAFEVILPLLTNNPNQSTLLNNLEKRKAEFEDIFKNCDFSFNQLSKPPEIPEFFNQSLIELFVLSKFEPICGKSIIQNLCSWRQQFLQDFQMIYLIYDEALCLLWKHKEQKFDEIAKQSGRDFHQSIEKLESLKAHPSGLQKLGITYKRREKDETFQRILRKHCPNESEGLVIDWTILLNALNSFMEHPYITTNSMQEDPNKSTFRGMSTSILGKKVRNHSRKYKYNFENYIFDWFYSPNSKVWCWQSTLDQESLKDYELLHGTIYKIFDHYFGSKDERFRPLNLFDQSRKGQEKDEEIKRFFSKKYKCPNYFLFHRAANNEEKHLRDLLIPLEIPKEADNEERCLCLNLKLGCVMFEKLSLRNYDFDSFAVLTFEEIHRIISTYLSYAEEQLANLLNEDRAPKKRAFLSQLLSIYFLREQVDIKALNNELCSIESVRF